MNSDLGNWQESKAATGRSSDTPPQYVDKTQDTPPQYRITIAGTPETSVIVANTLKQAGHSVVQVLTPFPKPVGRKKILTACPLEQWATEHGIEAIHVDKERIKSAEELKPLLQPVEFLISADFGYLIPSWLLGWPSIAALNLHPSLLPRWRGATPAPMTLLHGESESGIAIIEMLPKFDTGPVLTIEPLAIGDHDTTDEVLARAFEIGAKRLLTLLPARAAHSCSAVPQPANSPTPYARKFTKEDGFIPLEFLLAAIESEGLDRSISSDPPSLLQEFKLDPSPRSLHNMIRALDPWPGTWTLTRSGKRLKILRSRIASAKVEILTTQLEGKSAQPFEVGMVER